MRIEIEDAELVLAAARPLESKRSGYSRFRQNADGIDKNATIGRLIIVRTNSGAAESSSMSIPQEERQ